MEHFTNVNNDKQALCVLTACPIDQVSTRQDRLYIIRMKNEASKSRLYVEMGPSGGCQGGWNRFYNIHSFHPFIA